MNNKQIFVKGLTPDTTNEDLENFFSDIGPLKRCFIVSKQNEKNEKVCSGIAYVWYALAEHAEKAIKEKNNKQLKSKIIHVSVAKEKLSSKDKKKDKDSSNQTTTTDNTTDNTTSTSEPILKQYNSKKEYAVIANNLVADKVFVSNFLSLRKDTIKAIYSIPHSNDAIRIVCNNEENLKQVVTKLSKGKENNGKTILYAVENDNLKSNELIIRNLSFNANVQFLVEKFSKYGQLVLVKVPTKPGTNTPRGFAFLTFKDKDSSSKVIEECNGEKIHSRQIVIDWSLKQNDYQQLQFDKQQQQKQQQKEDDENKDDEDEEENQDEEEENDEENDDEKEDDDEDEEMKEETDDEEGEEEEEEEGEEEGEEGEENKPDIKKKMAIDHTRNKKEVEELKTLFIRNLAFDTKEEDLGAKFEQFGKLVFCRLVLDKITQKPTGKAFVKYYEQEDARRAVEACSSAPLYDLSLEEKINKNKKDSKKESKKNTLSVSSLLQGGVMMDGRCLVVCFAVDHQQATSFKEKKVENVDRKNRHLLNIGKILQNSEEGKALDEKDWALRNQADRENQTKLKINPNYYVSPTRLCLRNLPIHVTDSTLKNSVMKILKESNIKDRVLFAKVVCDNERVNSEGKAKSKGFAFIECSTHQGALEILYKTNNNSKLFYSQSNPKSKDQRVFTQFAVEDARAVKKQNEYLEKQSKKQQQQKIERSILKKQHKEQQPLDENGKPIPIEKKISRGQKQRQKKRDQRSKLESQGVDVDALNQQKQLYNEKKKLQKDLREINSKKPRITQQQQEKLIKQHKQKLINGKPIHTSTTVPKDKTVLLNRPQNIIDAANKRKQPTEEFDLLAKNYLKNKIITDERAQKKRKWFH
ncbi:hypothetical protein RB653_006693 [Dictyostelium firmibasis]|uniref:RRM domain-containing protein n=1 Tax=Dictyostelium firmibasis TaxID=79012 RepID=A0AAN7TUL9_9MYCE